MHTYSSFQSWYHSLYAALYWQDSEETGKVSQKYTVRDDSDMCDKWNWGSGYLVSNWAKAGILLCCIMAIKLSNESSDNRSWLFCLLESLYNRSVQQNGAIFPSLVSAAILSVYEVKHISRIRKTRHYWTIVILMHEPQTFSNVQSAWTSCTSSTKDICGSAARELTAHSRCT